MTENTQGLATDQFFYFFLRLRKGEVRRTVQTARTRYPDESEAQLAARLVSAKSRLAFAGGALMNLPMLWPGIGQALKIAGVVGATSMLTRMHLYLILEIAELFGQDIDDKSRVPEMIAVVSATAAGTMVPPLLVRSLQVNPIYAIPAGAFSAGVVTQAIGRTAIAYYQGKLEVPMESDVAAV